MTIDKLITRDYPTVSILEDTRDMSDWFRGHDYCVVLDEEMEAVGIVTAADMQEEKCRQLIDCKLNKPKADLSQKLNEVYEMMSTSHCIYLPVYEGAKFTGVVSLWAITARLLELSI